MPDSTPFEAVPQELDFPKSEQRILELWKKRGVIERALAAGREAPSYVFYEGPPTANGMPHNGHVLTRVIKDLFPRYHSMLGARVLRKGGWDTHGLPVEVEVEKELGIHGKAAIEEYGVRAFVARCIESVFRYTAEWERQTERLAFWVGLDDAYVTYHKSFIQSVWWALATLFEKGLLYRGHKVVWWWAQGGTTLSSAEVGLGYKTVDDPSIFVVLPLIDDPTTGLVVWTTTPWTLPSNGYAAVKPGQPYDVVRLGQALAEKNARPRPELGVERMIVASALRKELETKLGYTLEVDETLAAEALVGKLYAPPFDFYAKARKGLEVELEAGGRAAQWWRVIAADFVTLDTGTGIVHVAPAFGEDDHALHLAELQRYSRPEEVELLCAIEPSGQFKAGFGNYSGRWVKDCDRDIIRELRARRLLLHEELYRHEYPYCWRADEDPLIQMARPAWFIRTTARLAEALANNQAVNWLPEHIQEGRFGDFLRNNVDWALSRERYWGTPLNVWVCDEHPEHQHAPKSVQEIESLNPDAFAHFAAAKRDDPSLNEHLIVHKPWIDEVRFACPKCGGTMRRVPEVIDVWFDSGCMPFAQWGFPHEPGSKERFDAAFPADFISEAIDQTRGWFYSLLMVSTLLFDPETQTRLGLKPREFPHPYKTCIVLGHVCDRDGKKEAKSKGNYTPPDLILDRVRMQFGVLDGDAGAQKPGAQKPGAQKPGAQKPGAQKPGADSPVKLPAVKQGEAVIARDDLEGMELAEGSSVLVYRADREARSLKLTVRGEKKLPRRLVLLSSTDREALDVAPVASGLETAPSQVLRVPPETRVMLEDTSAPAPGSDAFRWFFYAAAPPWSNTRHSLKNVRAAQREFLVKIRNVYSFFVIYANIDGWSPARTEHAARPVNERALLDRWILSELAIATLEVRAALDGYLVFDAATRLTELAESLSNWYVRRSRARFWGPGIDTDKRDAYGTLHHVLVTLSRLMAPFVPFLSDEIYQNLVVRAGLAGAKDSVHFEAFPESDAGLVDEALVLDMKSVREIVSLGLSVRTAEKLKVRQPLSRADVVFNDERLSARLQAHVELIKDELNVHELSFMSKGHEAGAVSFRVKPNFRALGPRLGKHVQAVKKALDATDGGELFASLAERGAIEIELDGQPLRLNAEEVEVSVSAAPGFAAETGKVGVVVLHTTLSDELLDEGLLRDVLNRIQTSRKETGLAFSDRIVIWLDGSERLLRVAKQHEALILSECLAIRVEFTSAPPGIEMTEHPLGDQTLRLAIQRSTQ